MKLIEALNILKEPTPAGAPQMRVYLACGFTALHLRTFFEAHLRTRLPGRVVSVEVGLFGDVEGNITRAHAGCDALAAVVEWEDLDPRLGMRRLGGWDPAALPDIVQTTKRTTERLLKPMRQMSEGMPVTVSLPTLPLPPLFWMPPERESPWESQLREVVAGLAASLDPKIRILNRQMLDESSPPGDRFDLNSHLSSGFPYSLAHASTLGGLLAEAVAAKPPKKGLITDLDDTLWAGILGDDGVDGISWDLEHHSQHHGLYQQLLASLAGAGVLVGVASKNEPAMVTRAFARSDLLLAKDAIYPFEVHWSRKSESVQRILKAWNIAADDVVFVDDSPAEVDEVSAAFPDMESLVFPKADPRALYGLMKHLRKVFGKSALTEEDNLRLSSIRDAGAWREQTLSQGTLSEDFLRSLGATVSFNEIVAGKEARALELINKTNQFNLNGRRVSDAEWSALLAAPGVIAISVAYKDRFGPLGTIAVLQGRLDGDTLRLESWVMSCRAFSRRIEQLCIRFLFEEYGVNEVVFAFQVTDRNGPLREALAQLTGDAAKTELRLGRDQLFERLPLLYHQLERRIHDRK